ncbi:MAG: HlyD family efflux transporter periplasmic adaptor subunit [Planctomycetota bacterium]
MLGSHSARRSGSTLPVLIVVALILTLVALFAVRDSRNWIMSKLGKGESGVTFDYILRKAEKGPFRIMITENGTIDSLKNVTLSNRVEGSTTIISLIPEGSKVTEPVMTELDGVVHFAAGESESSKSVKVVAPDGTEKSYPLVLGEFTKVLVEDRQQVRKGDFLSGDVCCELDASSLKEKFQDQKIKVTTATANLDKAGKDIEIQRTTNESNVAKAKLAEELAQLDFASYTSAGGEYAQAVETIRGDLKKTEEELSINKEEYERIRDQARLGYANVNQLESARLKVTQSQITLKVKTGELAVLENFTKIRKESELKQTAEDTKRETARAKLEGEALMTQMQAAYDAAKLTLDIETEKLETYRRQIQACQLVAPQAGEVVYAAQQGGRGSEPVVIEQGASVRERQAIINLPDLEHMKIDARIHESRISRIVIGQPVEIEIDALPGEPYRGKLASVSSVPVPGSWPNTDLKEYEAIVEILETPEKTRKLKPGMTAQVRIIVEDRKDPVLQVPVQSVVSFSGNYFTYAVGGKGAELREIKVGDANDEFMEVLDGVKEGESVVMSPRTYFSKELSALEQEKSAEAEARREKVETPDRKGGPRGAAAGGPGAMGSGPGNGGGPGAGGAGGGRPGGGPGGGGGFQMPTDAKSMHEGMDKNKDGFITKDEHPYPQAFDRNDADKDGKISIEESETAFKAMQERMKKQ